MKLLHRSCYQLVLITVAQFLLYANRYLVIAEVPCTGSVLEEQCRTNADCLGEGVICSDKTCQCHPNYIEFQGSNGKPGYCQKAPDQVGASCLKPAAYCKPPLVCEGSTSCVCVRGKVRNGTCFAKTHIGDYCEDDFDCTAQFTNCNKDTKQCQCIPGSTLDSGRRKCKAEKQCPDGSQPTGQVCRSLIPDGSEAFDNIPNSGKNVDDCGEGQYCVTDGISPFGFCCGSNDKLPKCPLGYDADTQYSCELFAENPCPGESHYCHRMIGPSFAQSLCCQKPCQEPSPIFANGACYERAYLNGACQINEQCDGGLSMECSGSTCRCRNGFKPVRGGSNDGLTCTKDCGYVSIPADPKCVIGSVALGSECFVSDQCSDANAFCFSGSCRCKCGFAQVNSQCVSAASLTTTAAPGRQTVGKQQKGGTCQPGDILCFFRNLGLG